MFLVWLKGVMLVSTRLAVLLMSVQPFGGIPLTGMARVVVIVALAVGISPGIGEVNLSTLSDPVAFAQALLREFIIGGVFAAGLFAAFGAFHFGGRLLEMQIGLGMSSIVDIATRSSAPLFSTLLSMTAAVCFFAIDGHLALLRLVHQSYEALPVGQTLASLAPIELVAQFSTTFVYGFVIVAPVVVCLLLIDIGLAFASRTMPQLNVFVMSMTIKCCVALMVLSVSIRLTGGLASQIFDGTFRFFEGWMH